MKQELPLGARQCMQACRNAKITWKRLSREADMGIWGKKGKADNALMDLSNAYHRLIEEYGEYEEVQRFISQNGEPSFIRSQDYYTLSKKKNK